MYFVFQCRLFPSLSAISASCSIVISSRSTSHMHHFPSVSYLESSCHHCHRLHLLLQTRHRLEHRRCVDRRTFFCHSFGDNSTRLQYFLLFRFYIAFFHSCTFVVVFPVGQWWPIWTLEWRVALLGFVVVLILCFRQKSDEDEVVDEKMWMNPSLNCCLCLILACCNGSLLFFIYMSIGHWLTAFTFFCSTISPEATWSPLSSCSITAFSYLPLPHGLASFL